MSIFPLLENTDLQAEMTTRMINAIENDSRLTFLGNGGIIETSGQLLETSNSAYLAMTLDQQAIYDAFKREHNLSTNEADYRAALEAVKTHYEGVA